MTEAERIAQLEKALKVAKKIIELKPRYKPELKFGWVRTFCARRIKFIRALKTIDNITGVGDE